MLGQFLCHASRKAPLLRKVLREKGHRSHGSMEGRLRVNGAVLIGCQVSAHAHAPRRLTRRLPCLPGPDNSELFHAKGQRRAVQAQAHCRPLRACEHPLGLLQRRQDQRPITRCERLALLLATLQETKWVLAGPKGAAVRLGLNRSTLAFRMKKLGIVRPWQVGEAAGEAPWRVLMG